MAGTLEPLWNTVPPEAQAALLVVLDSLERRIADLEARLNQNSTNSSRPPSSDPVGLKRKPPARPSGRKRGGRPGHKKALRPLVPAGQLRSSTDCNPTACRRCGRALHGDDPAPLAHQVAELPRIEPVVDQYRLHRLRCSGCGATTCATLPLGVPSGNFGPYLQAALATLAGAYRLGERPIQQLAGDLLGLSISTSMISKLERQSAAVLARPYRDLADSVPHAEVVNIDETGWREDRRKAWLWVTATACTTAFTIAARRTAKVAQSLLGDKEDQVVGSDRFSAYTWLPSFWRQLCWSHLRRDFQAMIDRGGDPAAIGQRLMKLSDRMFDFWHQAREERRTREEILRLQPAVQRALEDGAGCGDASTAGTCAEILRVEEGLWNFVWFPGVEPTNKVAERASRHAVLWRRTSGGTDSVDGSRFAERMLTVRATCRQQGRNMLDYLTAAFEARQRGQAIPSLLPADEPDLKIA